MRPITLLLAAALSVLPACGAFPILTGTGSSVPQTSAPGSSSSDAAWMLINDTKHPGVEKTFRELGFETGYTIWGGYIDKDKDAKIDDPNAFRRAVAKVVPRGFRGIVALDWEGACFEALNTPPSSARFKDAVREMTELLRLARLERPEAKFGFYGLPIREYWSRDETWRKQGMALSDFFEHVDWVGPSVYSFYSDGESAAVTRARQAAYTKENVELALKAASASGKPVLPWVNHRYHPSNKTNGQKLIPESQFRTILRDIRSVSVDGKGVAGIIWWARDDHYYKKGDVQVAGHAPSTLHKIHRDYAQMIESESPRAR